MDKKLNEVVNNLRETAISLAGDGQSSMSNEIALMAKALEVLEKTPPTLNTKDFGYPTGKEVSLNGEEGMDAFIERIIDENDLLPVWFLEKGVKVQRAVARVVLTKAVSGLPPGSGWATGFLVSPSLFLTNNHVIPNLAFNSKIRMQFNFQLGSEGFEQPTESYLPDPDDVFHTNPTLDYSLVRLKAAPSAGMSAISLPGQNWGFIQLNDNPVYREKQHFNVIQHPSGRRKEVALQNNEIETLFQHFVRYQADTEPGSSGSPVFDNLWQLVALHHAGGERDQSGKWINNQGVRVDSIVEDLRSAFANRSAVLTELGIT